MLPNFGWLDNVVNAKLVAPICELGSTPFHSTPLVYKPAAPRIQSAGHVTCYGAVTRDGSTPLHSTPLAYEPTYVRSTPRIQSGGHVTSHGPVTRDEVPEPDVCISHPLL